MHVSDGNPTKLNSCSPNRPIFRHWSKQLHNVLFPEMLAPLSPNVCIQLEYKYAAISNAHDQQYLRDLHFI